MFGMKEVRIICIANKFLLKFLQAEQSSIGSLLEPYEKTNTFTPTSSRDVDRSIIYIPTLDRVLWHESGSSVLREFDPVRIY